MQAVAVRNCSIEVQGMKVIIDALTVTLPPPAALRRETIYQHKLCGSSLLHAEQIQRAGSGVSVKEAGCETCSCSRRR